MTKFDRSVRRHHLARLKRTRQRITSYAWGWSPEGFDPAFVGILANTACLCSCWMCGHQRRGHGLPVGEQRRLAAYRDNIHDLTRPATAAWSMGGRQ